VISIHWTRLDEPGEETATLSSCELGSWRLAGAVTLDGNTIRYSILTDPRWCTLFATVNEHEIAVEKGVWTMDGLEVPEVRGCIDIDLNFTPGTNVLPIRRLNLAVGQPVDVRAAWLRYPAFAMEVLEQTYTRIDDTHVHYSSAGGTFQRTLTVNADGLVVDYPGLWIATANT
jgi:hypothetical protein